MRFWCAIILFSILAIACHSNVEYNQYVSLPNGWNKDRPVSFTFTSTDTLSQHNIFIMIRNNEQYPYSNLFLITHFEMPNKQIVIDTLEYEMANAQGEWLGYGYSGIKESKLWYKEKVTFPNNGTYSLKIEQAMRKIGETDGIKILDGITEVGIRVEKSEKQ